MDLSEDPMVPEDLRMAYKVLKNAGCLPPELELRARRKELNVKLLRFNLLKKRPVFSPQGPSSARSALLAPVGSDARCGGGSRCGDLAADVRTGGTAVQRSGRR
jgi:hypothetical protein